MVAITEKMRVLNPLLWLILALSALGGVYLSNDNTPPFVLRGYTVFNAPAGHVAFINGNAARDLKRDCSVKFSRFLMDSQRIRHEISSESTMSAEALRAMDREMGGALRLSIRIPPDAATGPASLMTVLRYRCNAIQEFWPIDVLLEMQLEVLP